MNKEIIDNNQMIISIDELKNKGLTIYKINQLTEQGILKKLNKKFYENVNFQGEESDFYYAYAYAPKGVVCLMSAAVYYRLSSYRPDAVDVAIQRKTKISTLPDWPELKIHYFTNDRFDLGVETVSDNNNHFRIYDIEKTVVDIVYYRNKIGIEEMKEVLINYLNRNDRNLNKLIRYANQMNCIEIINNYLEVLI